MVAVVTVGVVGYPGMAVVALLWQVVQPFWTDGTEEDWYYFGSEYCSDCSDVQLVLSDLLSCSGLSARRKYFFAFHSILLNAN